MDAVVSKAKRFYRQELGSERGRQANLVGPIFSSSAM
jgi:hypothetical protein